MEILKQLSRSISTWADSFIAFKLNQHIWTMFAKYWPHRDDHRKPNHSLRQEHLHSNHDEFQRFHDHHRHYDNEYHGDGYLHDPDRYHRNHRERDSYEIKKVRQSQVLFENNKFWREVLSSLKNIKSSS